MTVMAQWLHVIHALERSETQQFRQPVGIDSIALVLELSASSKIADRYSLDV